MTALVALAALARPALAEAQAPADKGSGALSREAVEQIIREYLGEHPEVILDSVRAYQEKQRAAQREQARDNLRARRDEFLNDPAAPIGGNPRGDVTVVEFFDYRCVHCRNVAPVLKKLVREDANIRVVYKEFPILGPDSLVAARAALAARGQGKYLVFHDALMSAPSPVTAAAVMAIAAKVGLDTARLEKDMASPAILGTLQKNKELAQAVGIQGTPAFVIGDELVGGATSLENLKRLVKQARGR